MNDFIHLESDQDYGGIVIRISSIDVFYYREHDDKTLIYVRGGTLESAFIVDGNQTQKICEMICQAKCSYTEA